MRLREAAGSAVLSMSGIVNDKAAYWEGYGAARDGIPDSANPHQFGSPQYESWANGYTKGKTEKVADPKPVFFSKSFWSGVVVTLMSILSYFQDLIANNPGKAAAIGTGIGVLMIVLRFLTDQPVTPNVTIKKFEPK